MSFRTVPPRIAVGAILLLVAASRLAVAQSATLSPELQSVRKLLEKYNDPIVAVHDGFYSSVGCISYPNGGGEGAMQYAPGAMGVHFLNMGNVGPKLDPSKPQVLIYEPVGDKLRLVAAEWFMPAELAGGKAPSVFGQELGGPMEGHKPLMPDGLHHYDLHVWLWKTNPEGVFSPTNPTVKCPKAGYSFEEAAPKMAHPHK
jgi:hypothetical protein